MRARRNPKKQAYLQDIAERNSFTENLSSRIAFNFKFFQFGDEGGQSFAEWEREQILADLNNKLKDYSGKTVLELQHDKTLEIYTEYPRGSKFTQPENLRSMNIMWARLRITGRRRLIGFFHKASTEANRNVFYVVFLDKNHEFAPSSKD